MKNQLKPTKFNTFRFWARQDWVLLKTVSLMALILALFAAPLFLVYGFQPEAVWEAVRNNIFVDMYAAGSFVAAVFLFHWLFLARLID